MTDNKNMPLVFADKNADVEKAEALAKHLGTSLVFEKPDENGETVFLKADSDGISLAGKGLVLRADLTKMIPRIKNGRLQSELLVKAAKIKGANKELTATDATAGLGEDALLLAAAGFSVKLYEYDPVIACLLRDSLERASAVPELSEAVGRMKLFEADSISEMKKPADSPDVILLDPMFPERHKSALIKKKFQLLQQLESPCSDEKELLETALCVRPRKVVIKRPVKGPYLADRKPDYSLSGKAVRYDCFVLTQPATDN